MESTYEEKPKRKVSKKMLIPIFVILAVGLVFATAYVVHSLTLNIGVKEPFEIKYAILGDGQEGYNGHLCNDTDTQWFTSEDVDLTTSDTMLPGQSRFVCVKIENEAGTLPYTITSSIVYGNGSIPVETQKCIDAFGQPTVSGNANGGNGLVDGITYTGFEVKVAGNAPSVSNCIAKIDVARG